MSRVLIVDDENTICSSLKFALEDDYEVSTASNGFEMDRAIKESQFDVVLLDLKFGELSGLDLIPVIKSQSKHTVVIMMTAYASVESSIEAMKRGVYDYILKPIDITKLKFLIHKAIDFKQLNERVNTLEKEMQRQHQSRELIGSSKRIQDIFHVIDKVRDLDLNVLIQGSSGTGKELAAREIHYSSKRRDKPFEVVNCGAIPSNLIESELFGYEKGAFTGAVSRRKGLFELADTGTLFLDEIGEMDMMAQVKLLRVIQTMEIFPLGAEKSRKVDVRIIAATNRDLKEEVKQGRFREDLFFRLNVVTLEMPDLKERMADLPLLIEHFIRNVSAEYNMNVMGISRSALTVLEGYSFPGNVRELQNIIERSVVFANGTMIEREDLPENILQGSVGQISETQTGVIPIPVGTPLSEVERVVILRTLESQDGNRKRTAESLKISERNLRYKLKQYAENES